MTVVGRNRVGKVQSEHQTTSGNRSDTGTGGSRAGMAGTTGEDRSRRKEVTVTQRRDSRTRARRDDSRGGWAEKTGTSSEAAVETTGVATHGSREQKVNYRGKEGHVTGGARRKDTPRGRELSAERRKEEGGDSRRQTVNEPPGVRAGKADPMGGKDQEEGIGGKRTREHGTEIGSEEEWDFRDEKIRRLEKELRNSMKRQ